MDIVTVFAVAVGLAMDAFAVSISAGIRLGCTVNAGHIMRLAFFFGFFQFLMTVLGWAGGAGVKQYIQSFDHWIAMGLLTFIGGKMIYEAFHSRDAIRDNCDPTTGLTVLGLSVATSIDALAVGLSLGVLRADIILPSIIIGLVAAAFTVTGIRIGNTVGLRFGRNVEVLGGLILIGIGVRIMVGHIAGGV